VNIRHVVVVCAAALCQTSAWAQLGGKVYIDFGGATNSPLGAVTPLSVAGFTGLTAADLPALKAAIMTRLQTAFSTFDVTITDTVPFEDYTRMTIGSSAASTLNAFGVADEIDFRNKRKDNVGAVRTDLMTSSPGFMQSTLANYAQMVANIAAHEIGHTLGLTHSDPISTFVASNGGGGAGVQSAEIMRSAVAAFNGTREYAPVSFGTYSRQKLVMSTQGVNVQTEGAAAAFLTPFTADPNRSGDAGSLIATARELNFDTNNNDVVLGFVGGDSDCFKLTVPEGTFITAELFSTILVAQQVPLGVGRITTPIDAILQIVDSNNLVLATETYGSNLDIDGVNGADNGTDKLIYRFAVPAAGTYGIRVRNAAQFGNGGSYELYVNIPAPGSASILAFGGMAAARRRRVRR